MKTTSKNKGNGIYADVSGNRLPLKSQSINNFCGIDISQPTPSESLSVPLFSLAFFHCGSARRASMKRNTSSVVGFIVVALYKTSTTCQLLQQGRFQSRATNSWQEIFPRGQFLFPVASNHVKALGLR